MVKTPPQQKPSSIPPLESGDLLNRYQFEQRYNAIYNVQIPAER